jgi:hypothetical protein
MNDRQKKEQYSGVRDRDLGGTGSALGSRAISGLLSDETLAAAIFGSPNLS